MKRVCFLGASTVEGLGDEGGLGWVGRLALLNREAGHPIAPYNLGVRGQTLRQIAARAVGECSARIQDRDQDLIVLGTGANDLARIATGAPRTPRRRVLDDFAKLLEALAALAGVMVVGPFPVSEAKMPFLSAVSGMAFDFRNQDIEEAAEGYAEICAGRQTPFLDLTPGLSADPDYLGGLEANDGLHTDGKGYQAVALRVQAWGAWQRATY
jgi:lysophospholipase L1-like esterase